MKWFEKNKKIIFTVLSILIVLLIVSVSVVSKADFGDFSGDIDFGGSDYSYSSDGDGSGIGDLIFFIGDLGPTGWIIIAVILILLFIFKSKSKKNGSGSRPAGATATDRSTLNPMQSFASIDPGFDEGMFKEKLSNLYVQMQNGWTDKDISSLRQYFTDAYFTQMERQLQRHIAEHRTNYVDRIAVLGTELVGWKQMSGQDHIIVTMRTRIVDYTLDDNTGKLLSGSKTAEKFMVYEWDMCRTSGKTTSQGDGVTRSVCPSCGAPVDINVSARCEYCGTVLTSSTFDWAICGIKAISQTTR